MGLDRIAVDRFIPAYTGNTARTRRSPPARPVHPRVHGEHVPADPHLTKGAGSSPRTRGTPAQLADGAVHRRFIPAYTGNTSPPRWRSSTTAVHPRVHGEHGANFSYYQLDTGSSPRTRGTRSRCPWSRRVARFIPAYTGNTARGARRPASGPVHPRVHGEHSGAGSAFRRGAGSSPRTRGTRRRVSLQQVPDRFIPAYTGNTRQPDGLPRHPAVHPRVHGEHKQVERPHRTNTGSSPRTRGTRQRRPWRLTQRRFIPAYTGNTNTTIGYWCAATVHPRVHGEHAGWPIQPPCGAGSSPRTRGTLIHRIEAPVVNRFIPAYTGNTNRGNRD